jgi:hypothetical protein
MAWFRNYSSAVYLKMVLHNITQMDVAYQFYDSMIIVTLVKSCERLVN